MAAASAAVKLGSFVSDEAICSIKNCRISGESIPGFDILESILLDLDFVRSRVMVGPAEAREAEQGTEPSVMLRLAADVASICVG